MKQASDTYVTSVPEPEISPEEQIGLVIVPDLKLRRTNPKRFDIHQDWYTSNGEHEDTSVSNRYDNTEPLFASLDQLDWEIEHYVEGSSLFKASSLHLFSFEDLLLKRRQAYLQSVGNIIIYKDFAQEVKDFIDEKFKDLLDRHPKAREHLNSLSLEFTLRPEDYRNNIGAEYYPETKTIGYYLPKETLKKNWAGVVHEIVHALQDFFQDSEPALVSPPKVTASYKTNRFVYRADRGEEQAYAIEYEFKQWVIKHACK